MVEKKTTAALLRVRSGVRLDADPREIGDDLSGSSRSPISLSKSESELLPRYYLPGRPNGAR